MPIIQTVEYVDFTNAFHQRGYGSQFNNLEWLFDYLEEYSDSTGEPVELDVIALCCEYTEDTYDAIASSYSIDLPDPVDFMLYTDLEAVASDAGTLDEDAFAEAKREAILEYLNDNTSVVGYDDETVMYATF